MLLLGGSPISSHYGGSFPMLLAGGRGSGFKHGQHVKWKGGRFRFVSDDPAADALPREVVQGKHGTDF